MRSVTPPRAYGVVVSMFFVGAVIFAFRPGSRALADEAARIPLEDE